MQIKNKRREELSDQLKQISLKIDKEILELRKHNNMTSSMMSEKRRESFGSNLTGKFKIPEQSTEPSSSNPSTNTNTNTQTITSSVKGQSKSTYQQQRIDS